MEMIGTAMDISILGNRPAFMVDLCTTAYWWDDSIPWWGSPAVPQDVFVVANSRGRFGAPGKGWKLSQTMVVMMPP